MGSLVASWSAAGMIGPGLGAALLAVVSPAELLLVNAATFLVSAIVLGRLRLDRPARAAVAPADESSVAHGVRAGVRAARGVSGLSVIVCTGAAATLAFSLMNLAEPLLARAELKTGAAGFALLVCVFGIGSTIGALCGRAEGWTMLITLTGGGLALAASAVVPSVELAAATFLATGVFAGAYLSSEHQLVARLAPEEALGRVFGLKDALDATALCAAFVVGALIVSHSDARVAFAVSGIAALMVAVVAIVMLLRAGVVTRPRMNDIASTARRRSGLPGRSAGVGGAGT
jgi:hypothetical protein